MEHTTAHVFKCEDNKGVIRSLKSKDRQDYMTKTDKTMTKTDKTMTKTDKTMTKRKRTKGQTMICKAPQN